MCRLEKRMRLKSGSYKVSFGLPEEELETEVAISLAEGSWNLLEFKPIYLRSGDNLWRFRHGISTLRLPIRTIGKMVGLMNFKKPSPGCLRIGKIYGNLGPT